MAFTLWDGRVTWDRAGKTVQSASAQPLGVSAQAGDNQVSVSWQPVTGATSYKVRRGTISGAYSAVFVAAGSPYVDTDVQNGSTYYYVVSAIVGTVEGTQFIEVSATPIVQISSANFPGVDAMTRGNWKGNYGADGYHLIADTFSYPPYA